MVSSHYLVYTVVKELMSGVMEECLQCRREQFKAKEKLLMRQRAEGVEMRMHALWKCCNDSEERNINHI